MGHSTEERYIPPSEDLAILDWFASTRRIMVETYRPPWILIMGLPVLVMETSGNPPLELVLAQSDAALVAARKPLEAGEIQNFCMTER